MGGNNNKAGECLSYNTKIIHASFLHIFMVSNTTILKCQLYIEFQKFQDSATHAYKYITELPAIITRTKWK